jgi:hypothetical protein
MAVTIWTDMLDGIYGSAIAVSATLVPASGGDGVTVKVVDKTDGLVIGGEGDVQSIVPAVAVRMSELTSNSLTREDLDNGTLTLPSGKTWAIKAHALKPTPDGELQGEAILLLNDGDA